MSELPAGWTESELGELAWLRMGKTILSKELTPDGIPVYSAGAENRPWGHVPNSDVLFSRGTVVVSARGSIGFAKLPPHEQFVSTQTTIALKPELGIEPEFLQRFLAVTDFTPYTSTTAIPMLTISKFEKVRVPVPPLHEQRRIVAKLDRLSARSRAVRDHLARVEKLAARAKHAILAAAFRGTLTEEWRGGATGGSSDRLATLEDLGLDQSERGEWLTEVLPSEWEWKPFQKLFIDHTDSKRKLKQREYLPAGTFPVIDQGEALVGGYTDDEKLLSETNPPAIIFGDHTRCVKWIDRPFVQGADGVKVLKPATGLYPRYGFWLLKAIGLPDKGYSRHMKFLKASVFPVAPDREQREIVRRIEAAFARVDRLTAEAGRAAHLLDRLDERLLGKAFRGELVPQDPNDEPAEALLARIREARAAAPKPKRGGRRKAS